MQGLQHGSGARTVEGPLRSKLIFGVNGQPAEIPQTDRLERVRQPVSRCKSGVQGKIADIRHGRSRHAESQNELNAFRILMATARADAWQEQPFVLEYHAEEAKRRYTPDLLVAWGAHHEVVEIKEDRDAELPENQARFAFLRELLAEHGYQFRIWKKSEICAEPRLTNAGVILRYRCVQIQAPEHERIRRVFSSARELRLGTFCEISQIALQSVLRLVLDGTLQIDWWEPLSLESTVSILPLGRQVWPARSAGFS